MADEHVCPWWLGYFHLGPIRRWLQDPRKLLAPYVKPGMTVLEVGPGMGFFTLDLARLVGPEGRVVAVDLQERMIRMLLKRARRAGLAERIDARTCTAGDLGIDDLDGAVDFAPALYVVHELPGGPAFFSRMARALAPGGKLLVVEPVGHVTAEAFEGMIASAAGFEELDRPSVRRSRAVLLRRRSAGESSA